MIRRRIDFSLVGASDSRHHCGIRPATGSHNFKQPTPRSGSDCSLLIHTTLTGWAGLVDSITASRRTAAQPIDRPRGRAGAVKASGPGSQQPGGGVAGHHANLLITGTV